MTHRAPTSDSPNIECPDCHRIVNYPHVYCPVCHRQMDLPEEAIHIARCIHKELDSARRSSGWLASTVRKKAQIRRNALRDLLRKGDFSFAGMSHISPAGAAAAIQAALLSPDVRILARPNLRTLTTSEADRVFPTVQQLVEELSPDLVRRLLLSADAFNACAEDGTQADCMTAIGLFGTDTPVNITEFAGVPERSQQSNYVVSCDCGELQSLTLTRRSVYSCGRCGAAIIMAPTSWRQGLLPLDPSILTSLDAMYSMLEPSARVDGVAPPRVANFGLKLFGGIPKYEFQGIEGFRQYWKDALDSYRDLPYLAGRTTVAYVVKVTVALKEKYIVARMLGEGIPKSNNAFRPVTPVRKRLWFSLLWKATTHGWRLADGRMIDPVYASPGSAESEWMSRSFDRLKAKKTP